MRQAVEHFPCLSNSVSQAPVDRGTIIFWFAQCSAQPNFAPPLASDRTLSVLTAPQSHWDLSAPLSPPPCTSQNTQIDTHLFFTVCLLKGQELEREGRAKAVKVKKETELRISAGMQRTMGYCPWFHYWLVFNLKQTANHNHHNLSTTFKHHCLAEPITPLKLSHWMLITII